VDPETSPFITGDALPPIPPTILSKYTRPIFLSSWDVLEEKEEDKTERGGGTSGGAASSSGGSLLVLDKKGGAVTFEYRSIRKWWRQRVISSRTFHQVGLVLLEFRDMCAITSLSITPVRTIVDSLESEEEEEEEEEEGRGDVSRLRRGGASGRKGKNAKGVQRKLKSSKGKGGRSSYNNINSDTEDEGSRPMRGARQRSAPIIESEGESSGTEDERRGHGGAAKKRGRRGGAYVIDDDDEEEEEEEEEEMEEKGDPQCCFCGQMDSTLHECVGCAGEYCKDCSGIQKRAPKTDWFCAKCNAHPCPKCKKPVKVAESITCGPEPNKKRGKNPGCERDYHMNCVGLKRAPKDDWFVCLTFFFPPAFFCALTSLPTPTSPPLTFQVLPYLQKGIKLNGGSNRF